MQAFAHRPAARTSRGRLRASFFGERGSSPPNYSITVLGYNYEQVRQIAEDLATRPRATAASGTWTPTRRAGGTSDKATELVLKITAAPVYYQLTASDVRHVARRSDRTSPASIRIGGEEVLRGQAEGNETLDVLGLIPYPTQSGQPVRLLDVATLTEQEVLGRIVRENQQYRRNVAYEFRVRPLGDRIHEADQHHAAPARLQARGSHPVALVGRGARPDLWRARHPIVLIHGDRRARVGPAATALLAVPMALVGVFIFFIQAPRSLAKRTSA